MMNRYSFDAIERLISEYPFKEKQLEAITAPGNVVVSAGAGSGKTTVMIARILYKLINGASLEDMLIVTFTRASAADMRVKLSEKLIALKNGTDDGNIRRIAEKAIESMSVCNIGTLHSYCQKLLKQYFFVAETDPSATVFEDAESDLLKRAAVEYAVEKARTDDENFAVMYDMLTTRNSDKGATDTVLDIMEFALSTSDPEKYLTSAVPDAYFYVTLDSDIQRRREALLDEITDLKAALKQAGMDDLLKISDELDEYLSGKIARCTAYNKRNVADKELVIGYKELCKKISSFREDEDKVAASKTVNSQPYVQALYAAAFAATEKYAEIKSGRGAIDYSDLEHGAYKVLENREILDEISKGVKYVFVDEFQDVNELQRDITDKFAETGAEMFVVGDIKQSIYGFRHCSPQFFKQRIDDCAHYKHIALTENFRSTKPVIDFINGVFRNTMTEKFGGVDYDTPEQRLVCGNGKTDGQAEFIVIDSPEKQARSNKPDIDNIYSVKSGADDTRDPEAAFVASSIAVWSYEKTRQYEEAKKRGEKAEPPRLGDVAILMRSMNDEFCASLCAELDKCGIPYSLGKKSSVKDYPETVALVDIARCIDNRYDDIALYTAMRSPMGGFTDDELAQVFAPVRGKGDRGSEISDDAYEYGDIASETSTGNTATEGARKQELPLIERAERYGGALKDRVKEFFGKLDELSEFSKSHDCADVLGEITSSIDYFQYVYETNGQAQAVESLIEYAAGRKCDLHTFLDFYDKANFEIDSDCGGDAVHITTIHSSKGLEYEFVIVPATARGFNESDVRSRVMTTESGVFVKVPEGGKLIASAPYLVQKSRVTDSLRAEELRLFYVALTRAKKKLIVCGNSVAKKGDPPGVPTVEPQNAKREIDFMCGVPFEVWEDIDGAMGVPPEPPVYPLDDRIIKLVSDRIALTERTNSKRTEYPIKTCVTAIAADAENGDYTAGAEVLTDDDKSPGRRPHGKTGGEEARLRGVAYHKAMELIDFSSPNLDDVREKCDNFSLVESEDILRAAECMKNLSTNATFIARERYFVVDMPTEQLFGEGNGTSTLVQGVIDLLMADADGNATIVDYKTGDPDTLVNAGYKKQLELYAFAVEKATGNKFRVVRKCLYSFDSGKLIDM